jgi:hypothetical protein
MSSTQILELRKKLDALHLTGRKVVPFKGLPLMEKAFFPGGSGLFDGAETNFPVGGVIVLGSNFGSKDDFIKPDGSLVRKDETRTSPTWTGLRRMFAPQTHIEFSRCFFTNAWPFLHEGASNDTGPLIPAWLSDEPLMTECSLLFRETLSMMQPKLIVALGGAAAFLGHFWPEDLGVWRDNKVSSIDQKPIAKVEFNGATIVCTAITHPSHSNSWRRQLPYQDTRGEIRLLAEAASQAGLA